NDYPRLLPFLAEEVLRGRKVVVFPEGGMVKDRRVLDRAGHYSIYSRTSMERRKHHTGAAVIALAVAAVKRAVLDAEGRGDANLLEAWTRRLGLDDVVALLAVAHRITTIVPANITFYPIRASENLLKRGAELFLRGTDPRLSEELLIEGNILLSHTDMDIRLGEPVRPVDYLARWERHLLGRAVRRLASVEDAVGAVPGEDWAGRWWDRRARRATLRIRDAYMVGMYSGVTVNLSHLAALTVYRLLEAGETGVAVERFHRLLYLAVKELQGAEGVNLHRSLRSPETYGGLLEGDCAGLCEWLSIAAQAELLRREGELYQFLPALRREQEFDEIRIENPVAVYANEAAPIAATGAAVMEALEREADFADADLARLRFDDELRSLTWDRARYDREEHQEVNRDEPATAPPEPFLWLPPGAAPGGIGVLLVHGFTAGPAEMAPLGEALRDAGYPVLGVRLKGHATSPWDLLERDWQSWLASVRRGYRILRLLVPRVAVVGFSGGGDLSLLLAAEHPEGLAGVVAVAAPLKLRDRALSLVPLVHGANWVLDAVGAGKGLKLFHVSVPENPHINYRRMPIRALYELGQLMAEVKKRVVEVTCPALVIQGDEDPTVVPDSAEGLYARLGSEVKELLWVHADRHGLVYRDVGGTHAAVLRFLAAQVHPVD
ncbi:MAG TPA: alpha/beta fold hydrolase, partial [Deferrisomatales bacterium]|nr:alpha/beta fold hydrolase [Deferrisomatales bacterium]